MEPEFGLGGIFFCPGLPGILCLSSSGDESPVHSANAVLLEDGQNILEGTIRAAGHIFGTYHGPAVMFKERNQSLYMIWIAVAVESNKIGIIEHKPVQGTEFTALLPVAGPDTCGDRLSRVNFSCPYERLFEQSKSQLTFVCGLVRAIRNTVRISGLIVDVPYKDAIVVPISADNPFYIIFELTMFSRVPEHINMRRLDPGGIVNVRPGFRLSAELRKRIPAAVEDNKHDLDVVLVCDAEEPVDAL